MDIENLTRISRAASMRGPAGTTGYLIPPERMDKLRADLATPVPTPTLADLWLAFVTAMKADGLSAALDEGELAQLVSDALENIRPDDSVGRHAATQLERLFLHVAKAYAPKKYTVFCRDNDSRLRPYLTSAINPARAKEKVLNERPGTTCVGVTLGELNIIEWELP